MSLRRLPRQGDNSKVEFLACSTSRLNMAGGMLSELLWGRSSLYAVNVSNRGKLTHLARWEIRSKILVKSFHDLQTSIYHEKLVG